MIKKILPIIIVIAVAFGFYKITSNPPAVSIPTADFVLFYGNTCPHCKNVEKFISENEMDKKITVSQLEVYENESNKSTFSKLVGEICPDQINSNGLPVPFLVDLKNKSCTIGDSTIIQYLTEKSKESQ